MNAAPRIHHHPSDELLLEYVSGALSEGWGLAVATHLALCPHCRTRVRAMEATAGMLMENIRCETAQTDNSWQAMKARLASRHAAPETAPALLPQTVTAQRPVLPQPLRARLGGDADALKWRPLGRGASQIVVPTADGETIVRLLKIPAGKPVPEHSHGGRELTLVLAGSFSDGSGTFARGDFEEADADMTHQPVAGEDEDCICLAVTDAPLKFRSWLLRLVQPVLGI